MKLLLRAEFQMILTAVAVALHTAANALGLRHSAPSSLRGAHRQR